MSHEEALSVFHKAIKQNDTETLLAFKTMGWDVHASYQNGYILLYQAVILGKANIVHTLVSELEIDVNIQESYTLQNDAEIHSKSYLRAVKLVLNGRDLQEVADRSI